MFECEPESFHRADFRHGRCLDHHHHFSRVQTRRHCYFHCSIPSRPISRSFHLAFQCTRVYYHLSRGFFETSDVSTFFRRLHVNCMHRSSSLPSSPTTAVNLLVIRVRLFFALSSVSTNVTFVASTGQMALASHMAIKALPVERLHNHYSLVPLYCHLLQHSLSFKECHLPSTG